MEREVMPHLEGEIGEGGMMTKEECVQHRGEKKSESTTNPQGNGYNECLKKDRN